MAMNKRKQADRAVRYLEALPSEAIPAGQYLVHNNVRPARSLGDRGFRAWLQTTADNLEECRCNFGGCKNAELHKLHYRVAPPSG